MIIYQKEEAIKEIIIILHHVLTLNLLNNDSSLRGGFAISTIK
jgi:hypothetical protein